LNRLVLTDWISMAAGVYSWHVMGVR